jgi:hypothetical protein
VMRQLAKACCRRSEINLETGKEVRLEALIRGIKAGEGLSRLMSCTSAGGRV